MKTFIDFKKVDSGDSGAKKGDHFINCEAEIHSASVEHDMLLPGS